MPWPRLLMTLEQFYNFTILGNRGADIGGNFCCGCWRQQGHTLLKVLSKVLLSTFSLTFSVTFQRAPYRVGEVLKI
jgi:hypothetical protein